MGRTLPPAKRGSRDRLLPMKPSKPCFSCAGASPDDRIGLRDDKGGRDRKACEKMKVSKKAFDRIVKRAIQRIPAEIRSHLDNLVITVREELPAETAREMGIEPEEGLLGLFQGVPLIERSISAPPLFPDTIFLFQGPLERMCATVEELEEEIEITVVHEVAHFIGMGEERLAELGYE